MGLDNRHYARSLDHPWNRVRQTGAGTPPSTSKSTLGPVAVSLAIFCLLLFTADTIVANAIGLSPLSTPAGTPHLRPLNAWTCASVGLIGTNLQAWRLLTFPFGESHLLPLFVNAIGFVVFGSVIEITYGRRVFARVAILSATAGLLACGTLSLVGAGPLGRWTPIDGAAAIALGLTVAAIVGTPREACFSALGADVRLHALACAMLVLTLLALLLTSPAPGIAAGHAAGMVAGLGVILAARRSRAETGEPTAGAASPDAAIDELDRVLAKISSSGMGSLSDDEKQLLADETRRRAKQ